VSAHQLHVRRQSCEEGADATLKRLLQRNAGGPVFGGTSYRRLELFLRDRAHQSPILTSSLFTRAPDTIWFAVYAASRRSSTRAVQHCLSAGSSGIRFVTLPSRRLISEASLRASSSSVASSASRSARRQSS